MAHFRAPTADPFLRGTHPLSPGPTAGQAGASRRPLPGPPAPEQAASLGQGSRGCRVCGGPVPVEAVPAGPMDAGVAAALVDLGQAGGVVVALGAAAGEAVDAVLAGAAVVTGVVRALIDVDVAHAPCGGGGRGGGSDTHAHPPGGQWVPALGASVSPSVKPLPRSFRGTNAHPHELPSPGPGPSWPVRAEVQDTLDTLRAEGRGGQHVCREPALTRNESLRDARPVPAGAPILPWSLPPLPKLVV